MALSVSTASLGEVERKRSYRRDTEVVVLPQLVNS